MTKRRLSTFTLTLALGALLSAGCSDGEEAGAELAFSGKQALLEGFSFTTGYQPAGSPIQVKLELSSAGAITAAAKGTPTDGTLQPTAGSGTFKLDGKIKVKVSLKIDFAGKKFEGPLKGAPDIDIALSGTTTFEPFLLGQKATLSAKMPMTKLATVPLAGALSGIPGVKGDLVINASADLSSAFSGVCAAVGDGAAQYTGSTATSGTLTIKPVVEISIPLLGSKKLDSLSVPVPIPATSATMDLGTFATSGGPAPAGVEPCKGGAPADGGPGDGKTPGDGPQASDGPQGDVGQQPDGGTTADQGTGVEGGVSPDQGPSSDGCVLGTTSNCLYCGDTCTGPNNSGTQPVCVQNNGCDIHCRGDYYDVDGKEANGCEALDSLAAYSTEQTAKNLGLTDDCAGATKVVGDVLSDDRYHTSTAKSGKLGTWRFFKLTITDKLGCALSGKTTFDLTKLPSTNQYRVDAWYVCQQSGKKLNAAGGSLYGGQSKSFSPDTSCTTMGDDSGTLYLRIYKWSGTAHSSQDFTITVEP